MAASAPADGTEGAAATEKKADQRHIMITDPVTGEQVKRRDWIRQQVQAGKSRGEVTQMVRDITGNPNFRYQIVFQATKDLPNITPSQRKKAAAAAGEGATAPTEGQPATGEAQG